MAAHAPRVNYVFYIITTTPYRKIIQHRKGLYVLVTLTTGYKNHCIRYNYTCSLHNYKLAWDIMNREQEFKTVMYVPVNYSPAFDEQDDQKYQT